MRREKKAHLTKSESRSTPSGSAVSLIHFRSCLYFLVLCWASSILRASCTRALSLSSMLSSTDISEMSSSSTNLFRYRKSTERNDDQPRHKFRRYHPSLVGSDHEHAETFPHCASCSPCSVDVCFGCPRNLEVNYMWGCQELELRRRLQATPSSV